MDTCENMFYIRDGWSTDNHFDGVTIQSTTVGMIAADMFVVGVKVHWLAERVL
jgi:hypothetical protein